MIEGVEKLLVQVGERLDQEAMRQVATLDVSQPVRVEIDDKWSKPRLESSEALGQARIGARKAIGPVNS